MSRPSALQRRRADPLGLVDGERAILDSIKAKRDLGIWAGDIKKDTNLGDQVVNKSLKSLLAKKLIKEVVNIQNKGRKHYMAIEFQPCNEITGGDWYADGSLDIQLITAIKRVCFNYLHRHKVATLEGVHKELKRIKLVTFEISSQQVGEILNSMVLDNEVIEVKSSGLGDYYSIPIGTVCYRIATCAGVEKGPRAGAFGSIPCGFCPRISLCTPDGTISPSTCVYFNKWLDIEF